jgi:H+-translocating NAD(P) transhydrogenase subunit beta
VNTEVLVNLAYIAAAVFFIFGLKMLGSPATARRGNLLSSVGMLIAIVVTLLSHEIIEYQYIVAAMIVGAVVGVLAARLVAMTSMPEMVALFNGSGGMASLLVGWAAMYYYTDLTTFTVVTVFLSVLIGGVTFSGSIVAWGKLSEVMPSRAIVFGAQRFVNGAFLIALLAAGVLFIIDPSPTSPYFIAVLVLALILGVMVVIPIGGADMPVVI